MKKGRAMENMCKAYAHRWQQEEVGSHRQRRRTYVMTTILPIFIDR